MLTLRVESKSSECCEAVSRGALLSILSVASGKCSVVPTYKKWESPFHIIIYDMLKSSFVLSNLSGFMKSFKT